MSASENKVQAMLAGNYALSQLYEGSGNKDRLCQEGGSISLKWKISSVQEGERLPYMRGGLNWIRRTANLAIAAHAGNCGELTCVAAMYLYDREFFPWDIIRCPGFDHMFLVVGRDEATEPHEVHSWNSDCCICDPWVRKVMRPKQWKPYLYNTNSPISTELKWRCRGVNDMITYDENGNYVPDNGQLITKKGS